MKAMQVLYDEAAKKSLEIIPEPFSVAMDHVARMCVDAEDKKVSLQGFING